MVSVPSAGKLCQLMSERGSVGCQILVFTLPVCEIAQTGSQLDRGGQTDGDHGNQSEALVRIVCLSIFFLSLYMLHCNVLQFN